MTKIFLTFWMLLTSVNAAHALSVDVPLSNPTLEARARVLFHELRCPVCQNQSIDDSDADLAKDLRRYVRQSLVQGAGDDDIRLSLQSRYGDFILLRPRVAPSTYLLWGAPLLMLVFGLYIGFRRKR
ncbi:MAG: cytochrome c-type biogenesis protein CcmH [Alphaproteobacteria bacterium]|nr:cytochrome c-type biogenesis protein CcmH [Alphaproteobacteria bacterium]